MMECSNLAPILAPVFNFEDVSSLQAFNMEGRWRTYLKCNLVVFHLGGEV
jgi:hypothetical protein